jgi:ABC-2 type transport system permease protein
MSLKNSITLKALLKRLPFLFIGIAFWILFYIGSYEVIGFIRSVYFFGEVISKKFLSIIFFSLSIFLILSNIITALSSFYISKDIPFLLSMPVKTKEILRLKTAETIMNSSWMVLSFIPPLFIAYGINYQAPFMFYIILVITFIPFLLLSGGIGITIAHLLTRIFSAKKIRLTLLGAGLLLFVTVYIWFRSQWHIDPESPDRFIYSFFRIRTESPLLPGYWITESVFPLLKKENPDIRYLLLILSIWPFILMLSSTIGNKLHINNIERIQPSTHRKRKVIGERFYPGYGFAVIWKDVTIFLRDTGQWSQLLIISALMFIYLYNFKTLPIRSLTGIFPFIKELMVLINMLMAGLILSAVAARFLYSSISLEGMAFWTLKTAPMTMKKLIWSKFLYGFIPVTIILLTVVLIANIVMGSDTNLMFLSIITTFILCISISGLGIGTGAMYPKFRYDNVAAISMSLGGLIFMLLSFLVVLLTVFIEAWAFYLYKRAVLFDLPLGLKEKVLFVFSGVVILILNALTFYIPMRIGRKRLEEDIN